MNHVGSKHSIANFSSLRSEVGRPKRTDVRLYVCISIMNHVTVPATPTEAAVSSASTCLSTMREGSRTISSLNLWPCLLISVQNRLLG